MGEKYAKNARTLDMYERLREGKSIRKCEEAQRFGVDERSIQRDIDDIRAFLDERQMQGDGRQVIYDRAKKGFVMEGQEASTMSNSEILAVAKILLESRAFSGRKMTDVLQKMVDGCVPRQNMKVVSELISNESFHYVELKHGGCVEEKLWQIGMDIKEHNLLKIRYQRLDASEQPVVRVVEPVAILFSEYYFYLMGIITDHSTREAFHKKNDPYPTIYRLDRIHSIKETGEKFSVPYKDRFKEGEYKNRTQFMFGGEPQKISFNYYGPSVEAVLDKFPMAKVVDEKEGVCSNKAEVFGTGVKMWLLSQGSKVKVTAPETLVQEIKQEIERMNNQY